MSKFDEKFKIIMEAIGDTNIIYPTEFIDEKIAGDEKLNNKHFSSKEIEEEINKIAEMLKEKGFKECVTAHHAKHERHFARPEDYNVAYLGKHYDYWGENLKDCFEESFRKLIIHEVYKHNGANSNTSIAIGISYTKNYTPPMITTKTRDDGTTFTCHTPNGGAHNERIKKFRPGISDKLREKIINSAIDVLNNTQIADLSKFDILNN
jgi:hypothetical protein